MYLAQYKSASFLTLIRPLSVLFLGAVADGQVVHAEHSWFDPRAELKLSFSDNTTLVETDKVSDVVLNLGTGLNTRFEGARTTVAVDYAYDYLYFFRDGVEDHRQGMFGTLDAEVWENHFNVTARAGLRETFLDRGGGVSKSIANRSENRRLIQNYMLGGKLKGSVWDYADWKVGYRLSFMFSPADNLNDTTLTTNFSDTVSHEITASVGSGYRFNKFEWKVAASSSRVQRNLDVNDYLTERLNGELWYKFNRHFSVVGSIGYTRNGFQTAELAADGLAWEVGARWNPGRKLDLSVRRGEEGLRKIWTVQLQHFFNVRWDLKGSYTDTLSANSIVLANNLQSYQFNDENGIIDNQGLPVDESDPNFSLSDVDFRRRLINVVLTRRHKRTQAYLSANKEWRTFDSGDGTASSWGTSLGFKHKITKTSTLSGTLSYRHSRFEDTIRVDEYVIGSLEWSEKLSRYARIAVSYSHSRRLSNEAGADLEENSLTFYLRGTF